MDSPQPIGDMNMSVQQIELEEVMMVEATDDSLERVCAVLAIYTGVYCSYQTCSGCRH